MQAAGADRSGPDGALDDERTRREQLAERVADVLDVPVTVLGIVWILLIVGESLAEPGSRVARAFGMVGWALWALFVAEYLTRLVIAPSTWRFLRRTWWQIAFLALPFLRFFRVVARLRALRLSRTVSSVVRGTRTAGRALTDRVAWLGVVTLIVILAASQVLYEVRAFDDYADALHRSAMVAIAGQPMERDHGLAQLLDVVLAAYSVVVFAALAGSLGAYFLDRREEQRHGVTPS